MTGLTKYRKAILVLILCLFLFAATAFIPLIIKITPEQSQSLSETGKALLALVSTALAYIFGKSSSSK